MTNGNGTKLGKVQSWWITLVVVVVSFIGITAVYFHRIDNLEFAASELKDEQKNTQREVDEHDTKITVINTNLVYMKETLERIADAVDKIASQN